MIPRRLLLNVALGGLLGWIAGPALALPNNPVTVTDPAGANQQAVDSNHNAYVAPMATTTGGAGPLCSGQIALPASGSTPQMDSCASGAHQVYTLELDNTLNQNSVVFFIYDVSGAITLGTTPPTAAIGVPGGVVTIIPMPVGWVISNQIAIFCTSDYTNFTATFFQCGATVWGK